MKKLLTSALVLSSTIAIAACAADGNFGGELDEQTGNPYTEERTIGATEAAPVVRSAEPVFESRQVK